MSTNLSESQKTIIKFCYDSWKWKNKSGSGDFILGFSFNPNSADNLHKNYKVQQNRFKYIMKHLEEEKYIKIQDVKDLNLQNKYITFEVTEKLISYIEDGEAEEIETKKLQNTDNYVNLERIEMIKKLGNKNENPENRKTKFDTTKLVKLLEEINDNWKNQNYYSVGLLQRTVINFVPPIFECQIFEEITQKITEKTKKDRFTKLQSVRKVGDSFAHDLIKKNEDLANSNSVDFRSDFDFLLGEIISKLQGNFLKIINSI